MVTTRLLISKSSNSFGDCTKSTNYNWYHCHLHVPQFFQSSKVQVLISVFRFLSILLCGQSGHQCPQFGKFFFCMIITRPGRLAEIRRSVCISKSKRGLCLSFSRTRFWAVLIPFVRMVKFQYLAQLPN